MVKYQHKIGLHLNITPQFSVLYIIFLTGKCNLKCRYCGGSLDESLMPSEIEYPHSQLRKFIEDDRDPVIAFYGGEPLLRKKRMEEIMDKIQARYVLQTNGIYLDRVKRDYLRRFSSILVSIDGRKDLTEYYRGRVYDRVIRNVTMVNKMDYDGELIARMVAGERTNIFSDVMHLMNLGIFTHVHWQIDAIWSGVERFKDFSRWVKDYNEGITLLSKKFFEMLKTGKIPGIVPFLGVLKAFLYGPNPSPPCGAGKEAVAITTDGRILACPICPEFEWNLMGDIHSGIIRRTSILDPCMECKIFDVCGGRCLFTNRERLWGETGFRMVCRTVEHLVNEISKILPEVKRLVKDGVISKKSLIYPGFYNTTEIIP